MFYRSSLMALFFATFTLSNAHAAENTAKPSEDLPPAESTHEAFPSPPSPVADHDASLRKQAGIGSTTSYARAGVVELGGGMSWAQSTSGMQLSVSPTVGWFFADNFELSVVAQATHSRIGDTASDTFVTLLLEPSAHIPVMDNLFLFGGLGAGATYDAGRNNTGFALAPRLGVNFLIGRSGVFTPSATMNWSSNSSVQTPEGTLVAVSATYGINMNYTVMF